KDEFLAVVSHELRSPLNAILGYNHIMRLDPYDTEQIRKASDIIERNARTQLQLIEDLLDTARIISGKLRLETRQIDLVPVLADALNMARPAAEAKSIDLRARYDLKPEMILGDAARLQQVISNLLSNAIKFTPGGGRAELRMEQSDGHIRITVSDTGQGIAPEYLPHIFDRFYQGDGSSSRRHSGLGLGLALVKHLVELHGGKVEAASEGSGNGASFSLMLPLAAQAATARDEVPAMTGFSEVRTGSAIPLPNTVAIAGLRLLVVDDQPDARMLLSEFLRKCDAVVTSAASADEALSILSNSPDEKWPDVLVLDIAMPGEDGYALLARVRALEAERGIAPYRQTPAVALTAMARSEDRLRALSAGFQMHVAKPMEPAELAMVISSLAARRNPDA
ncbi:MAG: hybrid sensor histidine kinase/response regulator, partial [Acidobacteriota bacterium]